MTLADLKFNHPHLLKTAFVHRSFLNESKQKIGSNERLEFLGDSILSLIISSYLYKERASDTEGDLTNLRSYIVKTKSLAEAAKILKLGERLQLSRGEEQSGGRKNTQLLANTYEALLGAIYLDQGYKVAEQFVRETLLSLFQKEITSGPPKDAKSALQEAAQAEFKKSPVYKILKTSGPDHAKRFEVGVYVLGTQYGVGVGPSKQLAEELAATEALKKLS